MKNYVIINGTNSNTLTGLMINELPPITKPEMRTQVEEIDGRDGDIITKLGYSAYDKTITIGLFGTGYDVDNIIKFFNKEGTIVFSNEPDKYYNFTQVNDFDIERLLKFKTASITFHCQPFKYPTIETQKIIQPTILTSDGESISINNTASDSLKLSLKGNTSQASTPTPTSPVAVNVVSGDNDIVVCGKNIFNKDNMNILNGYLYGNQMNISTTRQDRIFYIPCKPSTTYTISRSIKTGSFRAATYNSTIPTPTSTATNYTCYNEIDNNNGDSITITTDASSKYLLVHYGNITESNLQESVNTIQVEVGSQATSYEPYQSQTYEVDLPVENLFNYNSTLVADSLTTSGITWTLDNGIYTCNGTNTSTYRNIQYSITLPAGTYRLSGCPSGGSADGYSSLLSIGGQNYFDLGTGVGFTLTSQQTGNFYPIRIGGNTITMNNLQFKPQIEVGSKVNTFVPYGTTPIELCKIGTYQDYIYKDSGKWYLHKEVGKVVLDGTNNALTFYSLNASRSAGYIELSNLLKYTETQANIPPILLSTHLISVSQSSTWLVGNISMRYQDVNRIYVCLSASLTSASDMNNWLSSHNTSVYYILATPTNIEITDTNLISQLDAIEGAYSYETQTNISQTNNDKPFIISASAVQSGTNEITINNIGNIYSKPLIALEGSGNVDIYLDDTQILKANVESKMNIDINTLEAYNPDTSALLNRQVIGNYNSMTFQPGNNKLTINGALNKATITNYTRWL